MYHSRFFSDAVGTWRDHLRISIAKAIQGHEHAYDMKVQVSVGNTCARLSRISSSYRQAVACFDRLNKDGGEHICFANETVSLIDRAKTYIVFNLDKELTLKHVAEHVYLNIIESISFLGFPLFDLRNATNEFSVDTANCVIHANNV